jgi:hypothetical protein
MARAPDAESDDLKREQLPRDIELGLRQIDEGRVSPFDSAAVERIKRRGRQLLKIAQWPK